MGSKDDDYLKKVSIDFVVEQLRLRGEVAVKSHKFDRHDISINDKDIKIKIKFSKVKRRSKCINPKWEFSKVIHASRLYPEDLYDYYILVGFNENVVIEKFWKISADDDIIYRKNQIFIDVEKCGVYKKYELVMLENVDHNEFRWID